MSERVSWVIDADKTLLTEESFDHVARFAMAGLPDGEERLQRFGEVTELGMTGDVSFPDSLRLRFDLLEGANRGHVEQLIDFLRDKITPSALEHRDWFEQNPNVHVISGGFKDYLGPVLSEGLGIPPERIHGNRFIYDNRGNIIDFDRRHPLSRSNGKVLLLRKLALPGWIVMVGDGSTDADTAEQPGGAHEFWAFTEHKRRISVVRRATKELRSFHSLVDNVVLLEAPKPMTPADLIKTAA